VTDFLDAFAGLKAEREIALQIVRDGSLVEVALTPRWTT
jgi:hypothetical protein